MKIWEISREEGKTYVAIGEFDGTSVKYIVRADSVGNLRCEDMLKIEEKLALNRILEMEFEEIIDWSKIPVDTKVLVSHNGESWYKKHFKEFKNNSYVCFSLGQTSWTVDDDTNQIYEWEYCKLTEE